MPEHHPAHRETVPQVVDARRGVSPSIDPAEPVTQLAEDPINLTCAQRLAQPLAPRADEEWRLRGGPHLPATQPPVAGEGLDGARVQRQPPRLGELALPYGEHVRRQVDIGVEQG